MKEYKQVNYKLPANVVEALNGKAKAEGTTATRLVLRGLACIGISIESSEPSIEIDLYKSIQQLIERVEKLEEHDIEKDIYQRISQIEQHIAQLSTESIENNIYGRIARLEQLLEQIKNPSTNQDIEPGIDDSKEIDSIENNIDNNIELLNANNTEEALLIKLDIPSSQKIEVMPTREVVKLEPGLKESTLLMRKHRKKLPTLVGNYIVDFHSKASKGKSGEIFWSVRAR